MARHLVELALGTAIAGTIFVLTEYLWHSGPGMTIGAAAGILVAGHGVLGLIGAAIRTSSQGPPSLSWDQDGLTYLTRDMRDDVRLRWSDLRGYRFTWEYPARLKILRLEGRPFTIDLFAFSSDDQARLLTELAVRRRTLPPPRP